ncbi:MAG TPA: hypothetical protein VE956_00060 [Nodularia sp. (in: cyanobacteria)]|nr:hypothetical protein [Nodularia sp. (in: cyanobacteria)]
MDSFNAPQDWVESKVYQDSASPTVGGSPNALGQQDRATDLVVQDILATVQQSKAIAGITQVVSHEVQRQLEQQLTDFQQLVEQSNLAVIDLMQEELSKLKEESATVKGAMSRLKTAIAPDIPTSEEVVSFRQAINNLEKYGSIIPSSEDIAHAQLRLQQNHVWSLFRQAIARLLITKMEKILENRSNS